MRLLTKAQYTEITQFVAKHNLTAEETEVIMEMESRAIRAIRRLKINDTTNKSNIRIIN
jgi:hypothetical protein